ncbi:MAG: hypothetical protein WC775_05125 [Patescibacteria group bacterium]|jgi:tRNA (guanine10-N2)-dimethyltransferase
MTNTKHIYAFILGLNHSLSKVEILNVLVKQQIDFKLVECSQEVLIIESATDLKTLNIELFGGVVKFVEIIKTAPLETFFADDSDFFSSVDIADFIPDKAEKITFGVSVYSAGCKFKDLNYAWYIAPKFAEWVQYASDLLDTKANFLPLKERRLSTAAVDKGRLLKRGFEMCLCVGSEKMYIGKTLAIQDYASYGFRDYGRPERDAHAGMIPPKIAKIMINLANQNKLATMYDPFCGSGTMLEEMMLLGFRKLKGSDMSDKAVADSKANLKWLFEHYGDIKRETYQFDLFQADVTLSSQKLDLESIDAIVTEPYLGSVNARYFNKVQAAKEMDMLERLYLETFGQFRNILHQNGVVVIIFPVLKVRQEFFYLQILDDLKIEGWVQQSYVPQQFNNEKDLAKLNLTLTDRNSIVYFRPDQTVSREIMVFKKTK